MADAPESSKGLGFLTKKVGPAPIWVYAVIVVAAYYWYTHYGPGSSKTKDQVDPNTGKTYKSEVTEITQERDQLQVVFKEDDDTRKGKNDHDKDDKKNDHDKDDKPSPNPGKGPSRCPAGYHEENGKCVPDSRWRT